MQIRNVTLKLDDELTLAVKGYYEKGEDAVHYPVDDAYPGSDDLFEITEIELESGTALDLIAWCDIYNTQMSQPGKLSRTTLFEIIEELCLEEMNN